MKLPTFRLARGIVLRPANNPEGFEVLRGRYTEGRSQGLFAFPGGQIETFPSEANAHYQPHKELVLPRLIEERDAGGNIIGYQEPSLRTAMREVFEETGIIASPLFRRPPTIKVCPLNATNMVIEYHVLVFADGVPQDTPELDHVVFVAAESLMRKHESGRRPFMEADLQAWEQVRQHGLLPGMHGFYPRIGYWPGMRLPKIRLPSLPAITGTPEAEPASA